jgi:hypothetical protein
MEFTRENLIKFEEEFYKKNSKFRYQRYGQALVNEFDFDKKYHDSLFYEPDDNYSRMIAWKAIGNLEYNKEQEKNNDN